jgi:stage II sporulation protein AA (anti-sigma F factor antagonist)
MADTQRGEHPGHLSVVVTATDGIRLITVAGEIDGDTIEPLRQALDASGLPRPRIVIDMHQVTFMDSSGINTLIRAYQTVTAADGWIRLAAPTDNVMRLLRIVGVDAVLDCRETLHGALSI